MRPTIRGGVRRQRWVVAVFAVIVPLAFPGAASADNSANAESLQYVNTSVAPVTGSDVEYDAQAVAAQTSNGQTAFSLTFKEPLSYDSVITANNNANASVNNCQHCTAVAISVQIVIDAKQDLAALTARDVASAASTNCTNCNTLAEAFQIVYAPSSPVGFAVGDNLYLLWTELHALQYSGLSLDKIQSKSTREVTAFVSVLRALADQGGFTPATNNYNPAELTTQQPVIDLLNVYHH